MNDSLPQEPGDAADLLDRWVAMLARRVAERAPTDDVCDLPSTTGRSGRRCRVVVRRAGAGCDASSRLAAED